MAVNILFAASPENWADYERPLRDALDETGLTAHLDTDMPPAEVDYIIYAPSGGLQDFSPFTRAKAVLSLWAGVEKIVGIKSLTMPLARMVDPGLTKAMAEYATGHVMRYHLGLDTDILNASTDWKPRTPPLAEERNVVVLGLGALGAATATTLAQMGFNVSGWSRRPKKIAGVTCFDGSAGLQSALERAEILITLLPDTSATQNILNARSLSSIPKGAFLINPGRGTLIDDAALLEALDSGQIAHATLDVFRTEPLPKNDPYWSHPNVTVTPHIAAETRANTASRVIVENVVRGEAGEELLHLVNRAIGY